MLAQFARTVYGVHMGDMWCTECKADTPSDNRGCIRRLFCAVCGRDRNE